MEITVVFLLVRFRFSGNTVLFKCVPLRVNEMVFRAGVVKCSQPMTVENMVRRRVRRKRKTNLEQVHRE